MGKCCQQTQCLSSVWLSNSLRENDVKSNLLLINFDCPIIEVEYQNHAQSEVNCQQSGYFNNYSLPLYSEAIVPPLAFHWFDPFLFISTPYCPLTALCKHINFFIL